MKSQKIDGISFTRKSKKNTATLHISSPTDQKQNQEQVVLFIQHPKNSIYFGLPKQYSVFSTEMFALMKAYELCKKSTNNNFVIFSDSLSSFQAIQKQNSYDSRIQAIQKIYNDFLQSNKKITTIWIPSHTNIKGNEQADLLAKFATSLPIEEENFKLPSNDAKNFIEQEISKIITYL